MNPITADQFREKFLNFFKKKKHKIIPSASLIPDNDPTALFINSGMHPLVPYFLGEPHPKGKRLTNVQKCIRTKDIEEVGDDIHLTFFEMLGSWSLGDYFKKEAILWAFEFLTKELKIPLAELSITCFEGDENSLKDQEAAEIWRSLGIKKISFLGKEDNWWGPAGITGPCGPDTEIFWQEIEIWNLVFMEYNKNESGQLKPLEKKNVDTGMGMERMLVLLNGLQNVYETDALKSLIDFLGGDSKDNRIIADHIKASIFIMANGVTPGNKEQGYVLRRLIRRAMVKNLRPETGKEANLLELAGLVINLYKNQYPEVYQNQSKIKAELQKEQEQFKKTLKNGLRRLRSFKSLSGKEAFLLHQSYGFPLELIEEESGRSLRGEFKKELEAHRALSRTATRGKFKAGLADHSEETTRLHTATHLLHQALKDVIGSHVRQAGSNITKERLRFDFTHQEKLKEKEMKQVEAVVNQKIQESLAVKKSEKDGISQYHIGDYSMEKCAGPHVKNTRELGRFRIIKQEPCGSGVRRIKAFLE